MQAEPKYLPNVSAAGTPSSIAGRAVERRIHQSNCAGPQPEFIHVEASLASLFFRHREGLHLEIVGRSVHCEVRPWFSYPARRIRSCTVTIANATKPVRVIPNLERLSDSQGPSPRRYGRHIRDTSNEGAFHEKSILRLGVVHCSVSHSWECAAEQVTVIL